MENASKALIIAGGMLIAMLIVSLFLYAWSLFSKYQSSQDALSEIENTAKFNEQFTAYDRENVMGYEIISLINKVVDYNFRMSSAQGSQNSKNHLPMTVSFSLGTDKNKVIDQFAYGDQLKLFVEENTNKPKLQYTQSTAKAEIKQLLDEPLRAESKSVYGSPEAATRLAKIADSLFMSDEKVVEEANRRNTTVERVKLEAIKTFNANQNEITLTANATGMDKSWEVLQGYHKDEISKYYEYIQFKKAIFKCTGITYDNISGRVSTISFEWTGKIK